MSLELKDFRGKITAETDCVLEAINRVGGKDRSEIAREVLHKWALEQITMQSVLGRLMEVQGVKAADAGLAMASRGTQGSAA